MKRAYFYKNTNSFQRKSRIAAILLFLLPTTMLAQQRPPFSEKTVEVDGRTFLPFTKGEVSIKTSGSYKPVFDKICSILTSWDSIAPPQGIKVSCSGFDKTLDIYFLPYMFEEGLRYPTEGGPKLSISVNDPLEMVGSPIVPGIYRCPQKVDYFYGFPIYRNDHGEVTIVYKKKIPFFIPVSQEEFLKALIENEGKKDYKVTNSDYQATLKEMEKAYQKLLKTDPETAKGFKQQMEEFRAEVNNNDYGSQSLDPVASLKKELSALTPEERKRQAYYGGASAMEDYHNVSELVPYEHRENGDALIRINPALINGSNEVQLLVIYWSLGGNSQNIDKPRFYNDGPEGFFLAEYLMSKLYGKQEIWSNIFRLCGKIYSK
ncbi:MAG: hypothetical protein Q8907_03620 [Bacteroidota bacterium]|nr:hypothetical protein [Bacteroidota bacterium]